MEVSIKMKKLLVILSAAGLIFTVSSCKKTDPFANSIYSEQPEIVTYQDYLANSTLPNQGTDPILASGTEKGIITKKGLNFKDSNGNGELDPYEDWRLSARDRATDLVSKLTVDEKLGLFSWMGDSGDNNMTKSEDGSVNYYGIPGLKEDGTPEVDTIPYSFLIDGARYCNDNMEIDPIDEVKYYNNFQGLVERSKWGIPVILSSDPIQTGWTGNDVPQTKMAKQTYYIGLGAADDLKTTKEFGDIVRQEMRMSGHQMLLGPQVDIASEPRWGRVSQVIHSNGDLTAKHVKVLIQSMQGGSELKPWGIATTAKHIPGAGSNEEGMDSHTLAGKWNTYPGNNIEEHIKPFQAAVEAGVTSVMSCYSIIDADDYRDVENGKEVYEGAAFSETIMTGLLRDKLGFDGATVSDWSVGFTNGWGHETDFGKPDIFAAMFNAGTTTYGGKNVTELWKEAYEFGMITDEKIDFAAIRNLEIQFKTGMFENPYVNLTEAEAFWDPNGALYKERNERAEKGMKKAMTLVKNQEFNANTSLLPVTATTEEYITEVDRNKNGTIDVYFDSAFPGYDSGEEKSLAFSTEKQYLGANFVSSPKDADIYVLRVFSRGTTYFGTQGGTPLTYDDPMYVYDHEAQKYTSEVIPAIQAFGQAFAELGPWKFNDWSQVTGTSFIGTGYMTYLGGTESKAMIDRAIAAKKANPGLKIVLGMTDSRPQIVAEFIDSIDGMIIDFAATDKAFLDVVFFQDGNKPEGRLPYNIPSSMAAVEAQFEDVPNDDVNPTFEVGYGLNYPSIGGYGS